MAKKPYAPMAFLRSAPNKALREFFAGRKELLDFEWEKLKKEVSVEKLYNAWWKLPPDKAREVEGIFQDVHELANEQGVKTLIEEGGFHELDFATPLAKLDGFEEQVLWVYQHHRKQFEVASMFNHADTLGKRSWRTRGGFPAKQPRIDPEAKTELASKISEFYQKKQSRGKHCKVENWWRGKKIQYFFAYPEDYAGVDCIYDHHGEFKRQTHKPAFEVIFRHEPDTGVMSIYATGAKSLIESLQAMFCRVMWDIDLPPLPPKSHPYELNEILNRNFKFETNPTDNIDRVCIRRLSEILNIPERIEIVTIEKLWQVAALAPSTKPSTSAAPRTSASTPTGPELLDRARKYVAKMPPAIAGQGGHNTAFRTACVLMKDFALPIDAALPIIREWNETCQPPWTEPELIHKLESAANHPGPVGKLLQNDRSPGTKQHANLRQQDVEVEGTKPDVKLPVVEFIPFPIHCLPEPLRTFVIETADSMRCDPCFIVLPLIPAIAAKGGRPTQEFVLHEQAGTPSGDQEVSSPSPPAEDVPPRGTLSDDPDLDLEGLDLP